MKIHYLVHKRQPLDSNFSQLITVCPIYNIQYDKHFKLLNPNLHPIRKHD
jgi:hypothetical protein